MNNTIETMWHDRMANIKFNIIKIKKIIQTTIERIPEKQKLLLQCEDTFQLCLNNEKNVKMLGWATL